MLTETRECLKHSTQLLTHAGTVYSVRSRETFTFTAYRVGEQWEEPEGKRGARKEREFIRKGYAVVTVNTEHKNIKIVKLDDSTYIPNKYRSLVSVRVTGEPDAVREYLETVATLPGVVFTPDGCGWEMII